MNSDFGPPHFSLVAAVSASRMARPVATQLRFRTQIESGTQESRKIIRTASRFQVSLRSSFLIHSLSSSFALRYPRGPATAGSLDPLAPFRDPQFSPLW